jgi:hypothetical protein
MPGVQEINRNDLGVMGAGVLALIASFFPFYGASVSSGVFHASANVSAWHSYGFVGVLLLLIAAGAIAAQTFAGDSMPSLPVGLHVAAGAAAGLGTLILLLHGLTFSHPTFPGVSYGMKWGAYVIIVIGAIETVFAVLGMRESGEKMEWQRSPASPPPPVAPPTA